MAAAPAAATGLGALFGLPPPGAAPPAAPPPGKPRAPRAKRPDAPPAAKDKAPKKAPTAFQLFSGLRRAQVVAQVEAAVQAGTLDKSKQAGEISRRLVMMWKELPAGHPDRVHCETQAKQQAAERPAPAAQEPAAAAPPVRTPPPQLGQQPPAAVPPQRAPEPPPARPAPQQPQQQPQQQRPPQQQPPQQQEPSGVKQLPPQQGKPPPPPPPSQQQQQQQKEMLPPPQQPPQPQQRMPAPPLPQKQQQQQQQPQPMGPPKLPQGAAPPPAPGRAPSRTPLPPGPAPARAPSVAGSARAPSVAGSDADAAFADSDSDGDGSTCRAPSVAGSVSAAAPRRPKAAKAAAAPGAPAAKHAGGTQQFVKDEVKAKELIDKLFQRDNRPWNSQLVSDNTAGMVRRPMAQKILEDMVASGELKFKDFGKNRVYWPNQALFSVASPEEVKAMDEVIAERKELTESLGAECKAAADELARLGLKMTPDELRAAIASEEGSLASKRRRLDGISGGGQRFDPYVASKTARAYVRCREEWRKRRRLCYEIAASLGGDSLPGKVLEELGIETDEELGCEYGEDVAVPPSLLTKRPRPQG